MKAINYICFYEPINSYDKGWFEFQAESRQLALDHAEHHCGVYGLTVIKVKRV